MKDRSFPIIFGGLLILIAATAIYVFNTPNGEMPTDSGSTANPPASKAEPTTLLTSPRDRRSERTQVTPLGDPEHPSQTEKVVDNEKYSSNPPRQQYEKDIIALATRRDMDALSKADQLLARISSLPPAGKVLAMEYATKLIPDRHYVQFRPRIFQLGDSDELREAILLDVLTRGDSIRMPTMVELLRQPPGATHEDVREFLIAYLDKDHGLDAEKWGPDVKKWLLENSED